MFDDTVQAGPLESGTPVGHSRLTSTYWVCATGGAGPGVAVLDDILQPGLQETNQNTPLHVVVQAALDEVSSYLTTFSTWAEFTFSDPYHKYDTVIAMLFSCRRRWTRCLHT